MNAIQKTKSILGYSWAALCAILVLATFVGMGVWAQALARATGIKVSPWFSGGEVARTIDHASYQTLVREPVFEGLFAERAEGFVQLEWQPKAHQTLPSLIEEELDVDGNGRADLKIQIDTTSNSTQLTPLRSWVLAADKLIVAEGERILRIRLRNPR
jgi:hypothetical protein